MARTTAESGPGYTRATFPGGEGGAAGGRRRRDGGGMMAGGVLDRLIDPELLRQAMLQGLKQRDLGFREWLAGQRLNRDLATEAGARDEDLFRNRNLPASRFGASGGFGGARGGGGGSIW